MAKEPNTPPATAGAMPALDAVDSPAPAAAASADDLESLLDTLAGPRLKLGLRVHRTRPDGSRGEMLFTVPASEHPDALRDRIAKYGPGEYELAPVADGRYSGQARRMTIEAPAASVPAAVIAPTAPAPAAGVDVAALLSGLASLQREQQAAQAAQFERMQSAAKDSQIELMKLFIGSRSEAGNGGGVDPMMKMLMPVLIARITSDPMEGVLKMLEVSRAVREESQPPDTTAQVFGGLAQALPALLQGAQAGAAAAPLRAVQARPSQQAGQPAPGDAVPAAPNLQRIVADMVPMLVRLAAKQADTTTVLGTLGELLTGAETTAVLPLLSSVGAVDALLQLAPALAPYRAWLESLLAELRAMMAADAEAEAGAGHAAAAQG